MDDLSWPLQLLMLSATWPLVITYAPWFRYCGNPPPHLPLPKGPGDCDRILETGVLPESHERDEDIRVAVTRRRQRRFPAAPWIVGVCCAMAAVAVTVGIVVGVRTLVLSAGLWLVNAWLIPRHRRAELARWDRLEAELDRRRRQDGTPSVAAMPPPDRA